MRGVVLVGALGASLLAAACVGEIGSAPDGPAPTDPEVAASDYVPTPLALRLNDQQYVNAVEDVLGVPLTPDEREKLPRDIPAEAHYATSAEGQFFNTQYVIAYAEIARSVTDRLSAAQLRQDFGDCDEATPACRDAFTRGLGRLLYRRPLAEEEVLDYAGLAAGVADLNEANFDDGTIAIAQALLQAPDFLYRLEDETAGDPDVIRPISGYELASRLSFFLWQSGPDEALLDFAATVPDGGAVDKDALAAQVDRLMADPRYARSRASFWSDYTLISTAPFAYAEPAVQDELRQSLLTTMERLSGVESTAGPILDMLTTDELWMTPAVAQLAGATTTKDGMAAYKSEELEQRFGITTHPSFLGAMGTTSFVGRGVFMSQRILCIEIVSPPSNEEAFNRIQETAAETEELTPREASQFRFNLEIECQGCHQVFEPIAYAFERYDIAGQYTRTDEDGRALYSDGELPEIEYQDAISFDDATQLMTGLRDTERVGRCLVQNMMEYATGHDVGRAQDAIGKAYEVFDQGTFDELVRSVALSPQLRAQKVVTP